MLHLYLKRFSLLPSLLTLGFMVLTVRTLYLYHHRTEYQAALQARQRTQILNAQRGKIFDCRGQCLVSNQRVYDVGVDLTQIQEQDLFQLKPLAQILKIPLATLENLWNNSYKYHWKKIQDEVSESTYKKICALKIKGVYGNVRNKRVYLDTPSLGHIVGFINKEGLPVCGIEKTMHFYLEGQSGEHRFITDGKRNPLLHSLSHPVFPTDGYSVALTLDAKVQSLVAQIVHKAYQRYHPQSIQALVTRPRSGEVLALVVYPGFDPNFYNQASVENLKNRVVTDVYEPGSVFKAITVSAALDTKSVQITDTFNCGLMSVTHNGKKLPLPKDWKPFNKHLSVAEILTHSSNRGVAQIALKLGERKLFHYGQLFGFGASTKSGFAGETKGLFYPPEKWDGLTVTRLPVGHALACSLMQMHYAMGAIANDGYLMYPQIVKHIYNAEGAIVRTFSPMVRRQVLKKQTAQIMRELLTQTPNSKAYIPHYFIAGKTGTTQKIIEGKYSHTQHVASMSGFFPSQKPQIQITVTLDTPIVQGTAYGAQIAAPVFKEIAEGIIAYLGIPPHPQLS